LKFIPAADGSSTQAKGKKFENKKKLKKFFSKNAFSLTEK
jgi:hypothetical protein